MWEFVDRIVYINLKKRRDRNMKMIHNVFPNFAGRDIHRFNAIEHTNGAIGCYLSHINVLREAIALDVKNILILEDDIGWNKYEENYEKLKEWVNHPYDVIMLGGTAVQTNGNKVISSNCSHAYMVNKHYMKTLLNRFEEGLNILTNDPSTYHMSALDQYWKPLQKQDNWLILQPCMLYQLNDFSDIENRFKPVDMKQSF